MKEKRLLIVMGSMGRGGAEKVISNVSEYFANKGWKVWIALLLFNKVDYVLHKGVQIVDLSGATQSRLKRLPYWIKSIRKLIKQVKPDTILSFAARINVITLISTLGLKKKVVVSERNDPFCDGRSKGVDLLTNWLYPKAHSVVFQTKRSTTYFKGLNNSCIIPNPVSIQCGAEEAVPGKIVTVGRLMPQKNQKMLISAFAEVNKKFPYSELHVYGEGELRGELEEQINSLGLSNKVFLQGNVLELHKRISDAAIFVLPSDYEGLSNALLEAMMMGLPCISTDCAGSDEYITDGENGLLTSVGNEAQMISAMTRLLENPEEAKVFGERAAKTAEGLQKDIIMEKWYSVME